MLLKCDDPAWRDTLFAAAGHAVHRTVSDTTPPQPTTADVPLSAPRSPAPPMTPDEIVAATTDADRALLDGFNKRALQVDAVQQAVLDDDPAALDSRRIPVLSERTDKVDEALVAPGWNRGPRHVGRYISSARIGQPPNDIVNTYRNDLRPTQHRLYSAVACQRAQRWHAPAISTTSLFLVGEVIGCSQATITRYHEILQPILRWVTGRGGRPATRPRPARGCAGRRVRRSGRRTRRLSRPVSGKKHVSGQNVQVIADLDGRVADVGDPVPGARHDADAFFISGIAERWGRALRARRPGMIGDGGYQGTGPITPHKRPPGGDLTARQKTYNYS